MTHEDFGGVSLARALQVVEVYDRFGKGRFKPSELRNIYAIPVSTGQQAGYFDALPKEHMQESVYRLSNRGIALAKLVKEQVTKEQ